MKRIVLVLLPPESDIYGGRYGKKALRDFTRQFEQVGDWALQRIDTERELYFFRTDVLPTSQEFEAIRGVEVQTIAALLHSSGMRSTFDDFQSRLRATFPSATISAELVARTRARPYLSLCRLLFGLGDERVGESAIAFDCLLEGLVALPDAERLRACFHSLLSPLQVMSGLVSQWHDGGYGEAEREKQLGLYGNGKGEAVLATGRSLLYGTGVNPPSAQMIVEKMSRVLRSEARTRLMAEWTEITGLLPLEDGIMSERVAGAGGWPVACLVVNRLSNRMSAEEMQTILQMHNLFHAWQYELSGACSRLLAIIQERSETAGKMVSDTTL